MTVIITSPIPIIAGIYGIGYMIPALIGVNLPIIVSIAMIAKSFENAWSATRVLKVSLAMGLIAFILGEIYA